MCVDCCYGKVQVLMFELVLASKSFTYILTIGVRADSVNFAVVDA